MPTSIMAVSAAHFPCVRLLAERNLQHEMKLTRRKPAVSACDTTAYDPSHLRKTLSSAAKRQVREEVNYRKEDNHERLTTDMS